VGLKSLFLGELTAQDSNIPRSVNSDANLLSADSKYL
jgi:hypothetical protein